MLLVNFFLIANAPHKVLKANNDKYRKSLLPHS